MKKYTFSLLIIVGLTTFFTPEPAYAHFDVRDPGTGVRAEFHATPEDDPIASSESTVSFDFSNRGTQVHDYELKLSVRDRKNHVTNLLFATNGNVVLANYTFPSQGLYTVSLEMTPRNNTGRPTTLRFDQRVSRGTAVQKKSSDTLLTIGAIVIPLLFALGILSYGSKRGMMKRSKSTKGNR